MLRALGGIALTRLSRRWRFNLPQWLGFTLAIGLALTVVLTQTMAGEAGLTAVLTRVGPMGIVTIQRGVSSPIESDAFERQVDGQVERTVGASLTPQARYIATGGMTPLSLAGLVLQGLEPGLRPSVAAYDGIETHARLTNGTWPTDLPNGDLWPVAMTTAGAALFGAHAGDVMCLQPPDTSAKRTLCVLITGLWMPRDAADPYWGASPPYLTVIATKPALFQLSGAIPTALRATALFTPNVLTITFERAGATADGLNRLRGYFEAERGDYFSTGLDGAISSYLSAADARALPVALVAELAIGVALLFVAITASMALDGERRVLAVWRGRGWSRGRLWALLMLEYLILIVLAAPVGVLLGIGASDVIGASSLGATLPGPAMLLNLLAPSLAVVLGVLAAIVAVQAWRAASSSTAELRGATRAPVAWWRWRGLDLWLAAASALYFVAARLDGFSVGGLADLVLPVMAAVALAVAGLRVFGIAALWAGHPRWGVVGQLASIQLGRRPTEHVRLALLVALAVGVGLFASVYRGTTSTDAADQAAYSAGADVRAQLADPTGPAQLDQALAGLPGVSASAKVFRAEGNPAGTFVYDDVIAVEPETLVSVLAARPGAPGNPSVHTLRLLEGADSGPMLPADTTGLSLWTYSSGLDGQLIAHLAGPGWSCECPMGSLTYQGWQQLKFDVRPPNGTLVTGLEARSTGGVRVSGELAFAGLGATEPGGRQTMLETFQQPDGWWLAPATLAGSVVDLVPGLSHSRDGTPAVAIAVQLAQGPALIRPAPGSRPIPSLVSSRLLKRMGVDVGQPFQMTAAGVTNIQMVAVAAVDWFPTLIPSQNDFLIAAREPLLARLGHARDGNAWPNELWLKLAGPPGPVVARLLDRGDVRQLEDRAALLTATSSDPLQRSLIANLTIGFVAVGLLVVGAFGLHFYLFARSRSADYAVLRANGLSAAETMGELAITEAVALGVSLPTGLAAGALSAWVLVPQLMALGIVRTGPPPSLAIDSVSVVWGLVTLVSLSAMAGWLAGVLGTRVSVAAELREVA